MKIQTLRQFFVCAILLYLSFARAMELPEIRKKASELEEKRQKALNWQLLRAIMNGNFNLVVQLIDAGAEINSVDQSLHVTPLHTAITFNHHPIIKYLLAMGADINLGKSVLYPAILNDYLELIQFLVESGIPITENDYDLARMRGNRDIIAYLKSMMPPKRK